MPNPGADAPLRKVTLNLYEADCTTAEAYYGRGWSEHLREVWQSHMRTVSGYHRLRKTLGEME